MWLLATLIATAISWAVVQAVSTAVVDQQPAPLSHSAVSSDLHSPPPASDLESPSPAPGPAQSPAPAPTNPPTGQPVSGGTIQAQPTPRPAASTPPPAPTSTTRTFTLVGGTAQLTCTSNQITLNYATPNAGYWVETGTSDGGSMYDIKFRSDSHESELQSWCSGGQVQGTVQEQSS
jgi:hypothetical protein